MAKEDVRAAEREIERAEEAERLAKDLESVGIEPQEVIAVRRIIKAGGYGAAVRYNRQRALEGAAIGIESLISLAQGAKSENARVRAGDALVQISMGKIGTVRLPDARFCQIVFDAVAGAILAAFPGEESEEFRLAFFESIKAEVSRLVGDIAAPKDMHGDS